MELDGNKHKIIIAVSLFSAFIVFLSAYFNAVSSLEDDDCILLDSLEHPLLECHNIDCSVESSYIFHTVQDTEYGFLLNCTGM